MSRQPSGSAPDWYTAPAYPTDAFMGAAWYYARYRVPYPPALLDDLRQRAAITGTGRLFDLACGPGRVALPLAPFFREVWAVDQEPEMIEVGQAEAARRGVTNVRWLVGRAEEVEAPAGAFELITIGEAFHRLNQWRIAERALEWLAPGGCLATLGCDIVFAGAEPWQALAAAVLRRWRGAVPDFGPRPTGQPDEGLGRQEALLRAAGFAGIASYQFAIPTSGRWTPLSGICTRRRSRRSTPLAIGPMPSRPTCGRRCWPTMRVGSIQRRCPSATR